MNDTSKFDSQKLSQEALDEVLQPLSDYLIPIRRLRLQEHTLGTGGFGTVKLADLWSGTWTQFRVLETPTTVAVKELRTENFKGSELRIACRLAREMKIWASCKHEHILKFTGYYLSKDFRKAYLVSPYMKNGNIRDYLAQNTPSMERRLRLVLDTIMGLAYLHSKIIPIIHGDLKSLNVLVNDDHRALLSDLGLAKAMEDKPTGLSTSNGFRGTIRYCSPEILKGGSPNLSSDMWAWGCLAMEIITDRIPYHEYQSETQVLLLICGSEDARKTPEPIDSLPIPADVIELLRMCWFFDPDKRAEAAACEIEIGRILRMKFSSSPTADWGQTAGWGQPPVISLGDFSPSIEELSSMSPQTQSYDEHKPKRDVPDWRAGDKEKIARAQHATERSLTPDPTGPKWGLTSLMGFMTATASEDWTLLMEVCEQASTEAGAKEAAKALRYEIKYADAPAMLSAARLWAIMLRNTQAPFVQATSTKKFLDVVENALNDPDTSPVVRDRLMFVLAGASAQFGNKFPNFRTSWRKVKPREAPVEGIPFDPKDPMFQPPPRQQQQELLNSATEIDPDSYPV